MIDQEIYNNKIDFVAAKGLVFVDGKILVIRRDNNTDKYPLRLDLPGGGKEGDESPFETFIRESKEEVNVDIKKENVIYAKKFVSPFFEENFSYFLVVKLPKDYDKKTLLLGNEGLEFFFMNPSEYVNSQEGVDFLQKLTDEYLNDKK